MASTDESDTKSDMIPPQLDSFPTYQYDHIESHPPSTNRFNSYTATNPLSQSSQIYNTSTVNRRILNKLTAPYNDLSTSQYRNINKISEIVSCEISNNISPSPTEYNRDAFLQSGLSYDEYIQATNLKDIRTTNPNLFDKLDHYQQKFDEVGFRPLHEYTKLDNRKFESNANVIVSQQLQIYRHLKSLRIAPNTFMIFESRHLLKVPEITQMTQCCVSSQQNENIEIKENRDGDDDEYESLSNGHSDWSSQEETRSLQHWYKPLSSKIVADKEKIKKLFYGYIGQTIDDNRRLYNNIPDELIQTFILFAYGVIHSIDFMMRMYVNSDFHEKLYIKPSIFKHYEAQFRDNHMEIVQVNGSKVPECAPASKSNVFMILNSVHSMHNFMNTLTFLNIKYHDKIMIYAYITHANGISYGTRITPNNLISSMEQIFPNQSVNIKDTSLLKLFESARDPTLEQYKRILFKKGGKAKQCLLNSFHQEINDIIDQSNDERGRNNNYYKWLILEDVLSIFEYGGVNKRYFIDSNNRTKFIELMQANGIQTAVADIFWYRLGGVAAIDGDAHVIEENMDDIESELDADLCFIQQQFKQDREVTNGGHGIVENDRYFEFEYPPWSEYEDDADENKDSPSPSKIGDDIGFDGTNINGRGKKARRASGHGKRITRKTFKRQHHDPDNIIVCSGRGKKGRRASRPTNDGNNNTQRNNNNHHQNPNKNGNPNKNNNNDDNNDNHNNGNQRPPNPPIYPSTSSIPQKGNCPFCDLANASYSLYLYHCRKEHPEIGYDEKLGGDIAVRFWKSENQSYGHQSVPSYHHHSHTNNRPQQKPATTSPNHSTSAIISNCSTHTNSSSETNQSLITDPDDEKKQNPNEPMPNNHHHITVVTPSASQTSHGRYCTNNQSDRTQSNRFQHQLIKEARVSKTHLIRSSRVTVSKTHPIRSRRSIRSRRQKIVTRTRATQPIPIPSASQTSHGRYHTNNQSHRTQSSTSRICPNRSNRVRVSRVRVSKTHPIRLRRPIGLGRPIRLRRQTRSRSPIPSLCSDSDDETTENPSDDCIYISKVAPSASHTSSLLSTERSQSIPRSVSMINSRNDTNHATKKQNISIQNKSKVELSYEPDQSLRVRGRNIFIPRELTNNEESKANLEYEWIDKTIAMQFNNKENQINKNTKVVNLKGKYAVIEAASQEEMNVDGNSHKRKDSFPWKMRKTLYTEEMIKGEFKMKEVPKPVRESKIFKDQLDQKWKIQLFLREPTNLKRLLLKTNWCRVYTFNRKSNNKRRMTLFITKPEFTRDLKSKDKNNFDNVQLFPILMFKGKEYEIHYIMPVTIHKDISIGISLIYSEKLKRVKVTGIHTDKELIYKQHQWIVMDHTAECKCLNNFNSTINDLKIGNPDDAQNMINSLRNHLNRLRNPDDTQNESTIYI